MLCKIPPCRDGATSKHPPPFTFNRMIMSTGAGFLGLFFSFHPFNPQKPAAPLLKMSYTPPPSSCSSSPFPSTCAHERSGGGWHPLREGAAGEEEGLRRKEIEAEGDRDGLISTSSTFSSKPTRSSEARQDPACPRPGSAACLWAGLAPRGGLSTGRRHHKPNT